MRKFYDLHVFYARHNGFSVPVVVETEKELDEDEIIAFAVEKELIDKSDVNSVDYVSEISERDFYDMGGLLR